MNLFSQVNIWKRLGPQAAIRYVCFCDPSSGRYAVQSADFFRLPVEESQFRESERQLVELFIEESVLERCAWFESIDQAIRAHDVDFGNDNDRLT